MNQTNKTRINGLAAISFLFSIAGIVISALLLKEDVISTAHTIFEYFPAKFQVTPSSTWSGAIILGLFISVLQVISANVAFSGKFSSASRGVAFVSLVSSLVFDNWTDIVFRSAGLTGNMPVAIVTTIAFYTLGSEVAQGLSWLVFVSTWRSAISDFMWGAAKLGAGFGSIKGEWNNFKRAARNKEIQDNQNKTPENKPSTPVFPYKPQQTAPRNPFFNPPGNHGSRSDTKPRKPD